MELKHKFFKDESRAAAFAQEVNGEVFTRNQKGYELELFAIEYADGIKEEFPYVVTWEEEAEFVNPPYFQF